MRCRGMQPGDQRDRNSTESRDEHSGVEGDPVERPRGVVHPLLRYRFSPTVFDQRHQLKWDEALLLVEAARWAPSAGNSQPWMFRPILRGTREHQTLVPLLAASSRSWAAGASAIVLNLGHRFVADSDLTYSEFSDYDLGQAVAHMTVQAQSMGLSCRQFRAFDHAQVTREFDVPADWDLRTMTAVGRTADTSPSIRDRRSLVDLFPRDLRRPSLGEPGP